MSRLNPISVKVPDRQHIADIVSIHQSVLAYTLNSQMGNSHLTAMYEIMLASPICCVLVAFDGPTPVGVVSGSIDLEMVKRAILKKFALGHWTNMLFKFVRRPLLIHEWIRGVIIGRPVYYSTNLIQAILTTIAVRKDHQKLGIGEHLIHSLEEYFLQQGVETYRLDTLISNTGARAFYKKLGFDEVTQRSNSVVLAKKIAKP